MDSNNDGILGAAEINASLTKYVCNGSASNSNQGVRVGFPSSTNWTCPVNVTQITVETWGAGGGGGGGSAARGFPPYIGQFNGQYQLAGSQGGSGGTGGYNKTTISVVPNQSYSIVVGTGGIGGAGGYFNANATFYTQATNGLTGGLSSFSGSIVALGGNGGTAGLGTTSNTLANSSATNGTAGLSAAISASNSVIIPNSTQPNSYIPIGYYNLSTSPSVAFGGGGATAVYAGYGGGNINTGNNGISGENGFVIISY